MKSKRPKSKKPNLSDKISDVLTLKARPDIEDDHVFGTKPTTVSRADFSSSESDEETAISEFRKRNVNLLSELSKKYEGEVVTEKLLKNDALSESESIENEINSESNDETILDHGHGINAADNSSRVTDSEDFSSDNESDDYSILKDQKPSESEEDSDESENESEGGGYDISQLEEPMKEEFQHVKKENISEEVKKGACVHNQLLIWEGLLEMRIHMQRCMNTANQMPFPETYEKFKNNKTFAAECNTTKAHVINILDKFLELENMLFKQFPETKELALKSKSQKRPSKNNLNNVEEKIQSDEEIPSDTDNEEIPSDTEPEEDDTVEEKKLTANTSSHPIKKRKLQDYEDDLANTHTQFKKFRDSTIQKWNDKTRIITSASAKNQPNNSILQQISYILSDRNKLIKRTQLKRSDYDIVGYEKPKHEKTEIDLMAATKDRKENDEYVSEIFDDSDFYHQLLRELIECKSADISDPVQLSRQWIALQQMRSKMKRKVDTKATKGRKIKYVVHNKLVNFLASEKCNTWSDESTNELYNSLFGKLFERNNTGLSVNLENGFKIKN